MSYIAFWPLAQHLLNQNSIAIVEYLFLGLGFLPPFIVSILLGIHLVHPVKWISPEKDRLAKYEAQTHLAQTVKQDLEMNGRTQPLYLPTYQWTSYFRFLGVPSEQLYPPGRASQFTLEAKKPCEYESILVLGDGNSATPESLQCFTQRDLLKVYPLEVRGKTVSQLYLFEYLRTP